MPKSDTWPGTGLETMNGMDSAGSCDSVVSANSGFSDDSLEHLSAEEKACLMFLEETIESLDTEDDSGLSNDEPDRLLTPGNLANKLADLSASMSKSKLNSSQKHSFKEAIKENVDAKLKQSYLIPTPLVVANVSQIIVPTPADKNLYSMPQFTSYDNKPGHKHNQKPAPPPVPIEVNVVIPPSTKPRDYSVRTPEGPLPRGPLSYEALFHLRKSASTKKTPLCPTIDHTIDSDKRPPVMAPKPKNVPANISANTQKEGSIISDSSYSGKHANDPRVVRQEALQKLGLLKDEESENETVAPLSTPMSHSSFDPTANRFTRGPSNCNTSRSPSFCISQVSTEPKNRSLQSSASFHHYSRRDQQPVSASQPAQSSRLKAAGLERSAALHNHRNSGNFPQPQPHPSAKPVKTTTTTGQPVHHKPSNSVGYTVMVVPGMGADRKEALRKLGLLKD